MDISSDITTDTLIQWGYHQTTKLTLSADGSSDSQIQDFPTVFSSVPILTGINDVSNLYSTLNGLTMTSFSYRYNTTKAKSNISCTLRYIAIGN